MANNTSKEATLMATMGTVYRSLGSYRLEDNVNGLP